LFNIRNINNKNEFILLLPNTPNTEEHLTFTEKVAVKLMGGVGDMQENKQSFFQLTISLWLCPLQEGEYLFNSIWNSKI
jgi:hypothetical protein